MDLTIIYHQELNVVESVAAEEISTENLIDASKQVLAIADEKGCYNLLVDIRQCDVTRSILEGFFDMEKFMAITGLSYKHKCAVIFDPESYPEERAIFIEAVVRNRPNPRYKMFMDRSEGLKWLLEQN